MLGCVASRPSSSLSEETHTVGRGTGGERCGAEATVVAVEGETYLLRETAVQPQDAAVEGDRWLARHSGVSDDSSAIILLKLFSLFISAI